MYYDTHVHTTFSPDGKSTLEEYAMLVDSGRVKGIGFAEHLDFLPECGAYGYLDYHQYISEIVRYRSRGYDFFAGAEIDYAERVKDEIVETIKRNRYHFTICSIHMINGLSVSDRTSVGNFMNDDEFLSLLQGYYRELKTSLGVKEFDVIGHAGIYKRYLSGEFLKSHKQSGWLMEMDHELAKACAGSGKILEVNTSGLFAAYGSTIADEAFLKLYYSYGGRMVSIGSDAHSAEHVVRGFDTAREQLMGLGFEYIYLPWDKANPVKLG